MTIFSFVSIGWGQDCDENMYWTDCGLPFECNPTCSNPNPLPGCMTMCEIGCFCNEGYIFSPRFVSISNGIKISRNIFSN